MLRVLLSSVALLLFTNVEAQQYPSRPIRFVMAYPPGGSSDVLARPIANEMTKSLGQPVLLEYKPGAGSTIGADFTAKSAPDGYTIVLLLTAHAVNATLMPKLPYDTLKDFTPITLAAVAPLVVEVNAQSPIRTLRELIDAAKAEQGQAELRLRRPRQYQPPGGGAFQDDRWRRHDARAVQGQRPGDHGDSRARSRPDVRRDRLVARADPGGASSARSR